MSFYARHWARDSWLSRLIMPISWLFGLLVWGRRLFYQRGWRRVETVAAPVIVVGNISVGGTGKTPLVIALVHSFRAAGYCPGVISRGYGGRQTDTPRLLDAHSSASDVGDEPLLIFNTTHAPTVVCINRVLAAQHLLCHTDVDLIISDDGLQHYALGRQLEICVVDGQRNFGNGHLLPAGPLREPLKRLKEVDFVVQNGGSQVGGSVPMVLKPILLHRISDTEVKIPCDSFAGRTVHAVAGIGNPNRFFATLRSLGMQLIPHPFSDHHQFTAKEIRFFDDAPVVMTEKDGIKCRQFAGPQHWQLQVAAELPQSFFSALLAKLKE